VPTRLRRGRSRPGNDCEARPLQEADCDAGLGSQTLQNLLVDELPQVLVGYAVEVEGALGKVAGSSEGELGGGDG
jgi:hypothetical protein